MNIIKKIKNWFKKKEPDYSYIDIEWTKNYKHAYFSNLLKKEFEEHLCHYITYSSLYYHILKCIEYDEIEIAIKHLNIVKTMFVTDTGLQELEKCWDLIKGTKQYKQMIIEQKLERMKEDFE